MIQPVRVCGYVRWWRSSVGIYRTSSRRAPLHTCIRLGRLSITWWTCQSGSSAEDLCKGGDWRQKTGRKHRQCHLAVCLIKNWSSNQPMAQVQTERWPLWPNWLHKKKSSSSMTHLKKAKYWHNLGRRNVSSCLNHRRLRSVFWKKSVKLFSEFQSESRRSQPSDPHRRIR